MSYSHLTISERAKIETYIELGYSIRQVVTRLNYQPSTISRELKRHSDCTAEVAQQHYQANKSNCGAKSKCTPELKKAVQEKLQDTWSPEQIVGRLYQGQLSFKTIYRWIYEGFLEVPISVLRQKGKRQKPRETRGRFNIGTRFQNVQKMCVNAKHLAIGNWILWSLDVEKQKAVLQPLFNV